MSPSPTPCPHRRPVRVAWSWPATPFHIVLHQPEIPPNTGTIARLCAATGCPLHLIEPLGFRLTDRALKRAGLDYWDQVTLVRHHSWTAMEQALEGHRLFLFSCGAPVPYTSFTFRPGDALVFGSESRGLSDDLLERYAGRVGAIPMRPGTVRSLNLATSVAIVLYEALRQVASAAPAITPPSP